MATAGRAIGVNRMFKLSSSCFSRNEAKSSSSYFTREAKSTTTLPMMVGKLLGTRQVICLAVQEPSTSTVAAESKEEAKPAAELKEAAKPAAELKEEAKPAAEKAASAKPKAAAKAPAKALPELMQEEVIPPLKAILEAQDDISEIQLSFGENTLEGSFVKKSNPYIFWAFFPDGVLTGPKGFSLSSYGAEVSTVEPFLIDEKKITAKHIIFWVEKRLAAQGIIPVWKD